VVQQVQQLRQRVYGGRASRRRLSRILFATIVIVIVIVFIVIVVVFVVDAVDASQKDIKNDTVHGPAAADVGWMVVIDALLVSTLGDVDAVVVVVVKNVD
jgi:ABC-type phosphate transport system permease subunit